jgi:hypothetical protein
MIPQWRHSYRKPAVSSLLIGRKNRRFSDEKKKKEKKERIIVNLYMGLKVL